MVQKVEGIKSADRPRDIRPYKIYKRANNEGVEAVVLSANGDYAALYTDDHKAYYLSADELIDYAVHGAVMFFGGNGFRPITGWCMIDDGDIKYAQIEIAMSKTLTISEGNTTTVLVPHIFYSEEFVK